MIETLFVFAHQDDEVSAAPWIVAELFAGNCVRCVYLTDGASSVAADIRDRESLSALQSFGVAREDIFFLSVGGRVSDNQLVDNVGVVSGALFDLVSERPPKRMYSLAWEGGHPDHDAAHLITLLLSHRLGVKDVWQFSLYNALGVPKPLFRTMRQLPSKMPRRVLKHTLREGMRYAMLCWRYPSQRRTWLGLFPGVFLQRVILRRDEVILFDVDHARKRPHEGELLYERLFNTRFERFEEPLRLIATEADPRGGNQ